MNPSHFLLVFGCRVWAFLDVLQYLPLSLQTATLNNGVTPKTCLSWPDMAFLGISREASASESAKNIKSPILHVNIMEEGHDWTPCWLKNSCEEDLEKGNTH